MELIVILCEYMGRRLYQLEKKPWVTVNPNALDLSRKDFQFLADDGGRHLVQKILFQSVTNLEKSLATLPYLPALTVLKLFSSSDLNKAFTDSVLKCDGLKQVFIDLSTDSKLIWINIKF